MTNEEKEALQQELTDIFVKYNLNVAVGLTQKGIAIRSQDAERVDVLNVGYVRASSKRQ